MNGSGIVQWMRTFGAQRNGEFAPNTLSGVTSATDGSVYLTGQTKGAFPGGTLVGLSDLYVAS